MEGLIMHQYMKKLFLGTVFCLALIAATDGQARAAQQESELVVSVDAKQRPLKDIFFDISKQLSWTIIVDERLIDKPISGVYNNIEFRSFLKRALKGENLIVLYDERAKNINIRSFSGDGKMVAISSGPMPIPDMKKLQAIRKEEQKAYAKYISNPDSIEPLTGMTLGEIKALREKEQKAYQEYKSNPDSVEPLTGKKLSEIKALRENEQKAHDAYVSNPDSIEPLSGMKLSEIKALRENEQKAHKAYTSNPDSVDPLTGKTLGDFKSFLGKDANKDNAESGKPVSNTP
jgi:hypothetical protein